MFNIDNICKTFWYDSSKYLDTLLKVTNEELPVCNGQKEINGGSQNVQVNRDVQYHQETSKRNPISDQLKYDIELYLKQSLPEICVDDPSQTFWDDPNMYVEDPGLESLLALANEEFLVYNNQAVKADVNPDDQNGKKENPNIEQTNNGNPTQQMCMYPNCGKSFMKESLLKTHMRRHTGVKPYVCMWPKCSWSFSRSDERVRHYRSHSGVKPYGCKQCERRFTRTDHLVKHERVHQKYKSRRRAAENRVGNKNDTVRYTIG